MRSVWITKHGDRSALEVRDTPTPAPKAGEVRVKVERAGLNFADVSARSGLYPDAPPPPCVVGYEAAGVVEALGEGVTSPAVGTRVMAMTRFWGQAEYVVVPADQAVPLPDAMSFDEAAAIPVNYLTAYHILFRVAPVRPKEKVLVHMAAGGVGTAALQLLRTVPGVETFGTASASKHDHLRAMGCTYPIDYRTLDYEAEVRRITGGKGVDIVMDALGGNDLRKGYRLLRPAGRLVAFGFANAQGPDGRDLLKLASAFVKTPFFHPLQLMGDNRSVAGVNLGHLWDEQEMLREELEALLKLYAEGVVKPVIDGVYSFDQCRDAHARLETGKNVGKVLLKP
ncbi:MAG: medium chain dehydrogenase/reductase family protein [Polyangiales bacterium]